MPKWQNINYGTAFFSMTHNSSRDILWSQIIFSTLFKKNKNQRKKIDCLISSFCFLFFFFSFVIVYSTWLFIYFFFFTYRLLSRLSHNLSRYIILLFNNASRQVTLMKGNNLISNFLATKNFSIKNFFDKIIENLACETSS